MKHGAFTFVLTVLTASSLRAGEVRPADLDFFEKRVRPVLATHCFECHGAKKQRGGLRLDTRAGALAGGDLGPAINPASRTKVCW